MSPERAARLLDAALTIREHADELTALDQAIGDGDHGLNMRRGFDAIAAAREELTALPLGQALQKAGMALVMRSAARRARSTAACSWPWARLRPRRPPARKGSP
jgi:dihydroxyacetone kinase